MNNDSMREAFEAWTSTHYVLGGFETDRSSDGNYSDVDMHLAWDAWQASCENLPAAYTATDMTTAAAQGFRDGRNGVEPEDFDTHAEYLAAVMPMKKSTPMHIAEYLEDNEDVRLHVMLELRKLAPKWDVDCFVVELPNHFVVPAGSATDAGTINAILETVTQAIIAAGGSVKNGRASVLDGLRDRILIALRDEDCIDNPSYMTDLVMRAIEG